MSQRPSARGLHPLVLLTVLLVAGCTADDAGATGEPTDTAPSRPAAVPSTPATTATAAPEALVLRSRGVIGTLPADAPEADVVAYLTERLGTEPEVLDAEYACEPADQPGRLLEWGALRVLVLTADEDDGSPVDAFVAGWFLINSGEALTADLSTEEGLRIGEPTDRVLELYPDAVRSEWIDPTITWWDTNGDGNYVVLTGEDGTVAQINSGYACLAD